MTTSVGIACPGNGSIVLDQASKLKIKNPFDIAGARPCTVAICDHGLSRRKSGMISATMTAGGLRNRMSLAPLGRKEAGGGKNYAVDAYERLDKWMQDSVVDIVKNLKEAPLLVQLYSNSTGKDGGKTTALSTEKKAAAEDWPAVKEKWLAGEAPLPEGIIFVEEFAGYEAEHDKKEEAERTTRAWGLVVQGKGVGCGPVCYLLKTCRVGSGLGMFCTHFCLTRVTNFRETVDSQLKNCWLLQSQ